MGGELRAKMLRLGQMDDEIVRAIVAAEHELQNVITIRIQTTMNGQVIAFGKHAGKWRLLLVVNTTDTPLVACSRSVRAQAMTERWIEKLVACAEAGVERELEARDIAVIRARELEHRIEDVIGIASPTINPAFRTKDGRPIDLDIAKRASEVINDHLDSLGYVAPEAGDVLAQHLAGIAVAMNELAKALAFKLPGDA